MKNNKRPGIITGVCALMLLGALVAIPTIFSDAAATIGSWYPLLLALSSIGGLITMVGLWKMKKWSVILYASMTGIVQLVLFFMGLWNIFALVIPGILIWVLYTNYKKMD